MRFFVKLRRFFHFLIKFDAIIAPNCLQIYYFCYNGVNGFKMRRLNSVSLACEKRRRKIKSRESVMAENIGNFNNLYSRMTAGLRQAMRAADSMCQAKRISFIGTEALLYGILSLDNNVTRVLEKNRVTLNAYTIQLNAYYSRQKFVRVGLSPNAKAAMLKAEELANRLKLSYISDEFLALGIMSVNGCAMNILRRIARDTDSIQNELYNIIVGNVDESGRDITIHYGEQSSGIYEYEPNEKLNALSEFGYDLTRKAYEGKLDPVIGRDKEIEQIIRILSRRTKNSPMLIGEPGVGKSAVVEGLAQEIVSGKVPDVLRGKTVFSLDLTSLIAGAKFRGEFEERFRTAVNFIVNSGNIIVFIDEIHNIMGAGSTGESSMDAAEMLKPMLARGEFQIIGATTTEEYGKYIEKDSAFARRFQTINVQAPSIPDAIRILQGLRDKYEAHHRVEIKDEAIECAVKLTERYITDRYLPDKAIDVMDEAAARAKLSACAPEEDINKYEQKIKELGVDREYAIRCNNLAEIKKIDEEIEKNRVAYKNIRNRALLKKSNVRPSINGEDIAQIISERTGVPVMKINEEESDRLMNLESELHSRVIGQDDAVEEVAKAIRRSRAGLSDPNRPIGSFIFAGPTGVGKTELSKALANVIFGNENMLIRLDMSEYMEKISITKLIGAPPGYAGYDEEGILTGKVRRMPYSVVLFDEIEKAHPDIFDIMLQILDDGRVTDSKGRVVDFRNTVIIMTSNCGASDAIGLEDEYEFEDAVNDALKARFRPEFLNRIDDIIVFKKLTKRECAKIAEILLNKLKERLKEQGINLIVKESAVDLILKSGYSDTYGVRPLKRAIQKLLENMLADEIISGGITSGETVSVFADDDIIDYKIEK